MKLELMSDPKTMDDARLVALGLQGHRDAFGELVARYQSLVCALAYCACGNISQSQDLAQEAFIIAWRKLGDLKEPAKFKSWLFGIVRNLNHSAFRQQGRNPLAGAEPLDESLTAPVAGSNPAGQAISKEEEGILWRSLERIPECYREPLVLFYREHQSTERVAATLNLSEEAARQRLSRGRKLLQEQVLAFVEGALAQTGPGRVFTLGVVAALPAMAISAKASTLGAAAKGGAAVKGAGMAGLLGGVSAALFTFLGMWLQFRGAWKMLRTDQERKIFKKFYIGIAAAVVTFVAITCILQSYGSALMKVNPALFAGLTIGLILGYCVLTACLAGWFYRRVRKLNSSRPTAENIHSFGGPGWEYRSRFELFGLPFVHIRFGSCGNLTRKRWQPVKAWIAISDAFAFGVLFAYAGVAVAPISIGACTLGLLSYGAMATGVFAIGGFGFGAWAVAPFAAGWQACGDTAIAWNIANGGQYGIAHQFALGATAHAAEVNTDYVRHMVRSNLFFQFCWTVLRPVGFFLLWAWAIPMTIFTTIQWRLRARQIQPESPATLSA